MKKIIYQFIVFITCLSTITFTVVSCGKDDDDNTTVSTAAEVLSFGPSPALRGGELQFIGNNLDKVSSIVLPNNIEVTSFKSKANDKIVIIVPEEAVDGAVSVKSSDGVIKLKALLKISEPIKLISIAPTSARPGDKITITGTYLNLIKEVIFPNKKSVTTFASQSKDKIEVVIPADAQSGKVQISNGMADPIIVESVEDLNVVLPVITKLTPNPVKPGQNVVIEGTDLDLITYLTFGGGKKVTEFISKTLTKIEVKVPEDAQDGSVSGTVASLLSITSTSSLSMVNPSVTNLDPNPGKNGKDITIKGTNLDLVTSVVFGDNKTGVIKTQTENTLVVTIPIDAKEGGIKLNTKSNKSVTTDALALVKPSVNAVAPSTTTANKPITISGAHLDLVTKIIFSGNKAVDVSTSDETSLTVTVPSGTTTGPFQLITTNGSNVASLFEVTILSSNVPTVTGIPASAKPGTMITLTGFKMHLLTDVIFPDDIKATTFGIKSEDRIEVLVPNNVKKGYGKIKFITADNEFSESDLINFVGVDAVKDPSLVFFDFDGKNAWWGKMQGNVKNDLDGVNGTNYGFVNESLNGWTDLFWRNSLNDFPGDKIGSDVNGYVMKFDINIREALTDGNLKLRLHGDEGDFWYTIGPATTPSGSKKNVTDGWETVTVKITDFKDNYGWGANSPTTMATIKQEFGMAWDNGASKVNILVDNVRFEKI